ncbi:MAG: hypothetical protein ACFFCE_01620 [Promethearchaeota archaeon]
MKIPSEINGMLERSEEKLLELSNEYTECVNDDKITEKLKNITHEIIEKNRHILDKIMRIIWNIYYLPSLSIIDRKKRHKIYFPIADSYSNFSWIMNKNKMSDLEKKNKSLYDYLLSLQPYTHRRNKWLEQLAKIAGEGKHEQFKEQKREDFQHYSVTTQDGGTRVSWAEPIVKFNTNHAKIKILNTPVDPFKKDLLKNPDLIIEKDTTKNIILDGINENVYIYCKILIVKNKVLVKKIFALL